MFTYVIYPFCGKFFQVTPLRKIGAGLFVTASSFLIVAWVEKQIQSGHSVSAWWQILAYLVLTAGEVLVSITALEFSYKQAPLRMKSFIMALFLLSVSLGNLMIAGVNNAMIKPLHASGIEAGDADVGHGRGSRAVHHRAEDRPHRRKRHQHRGRREAAAARGNLPRRRDRRRREPGPPHGRRQPGAA